MTKNKKLLKYVSTALKKGFDKEKIQEKLLKAGYSEQVIEETFYECEVPKARFFKKKIVLQMGNKPKLNVPVYTNEEELKADEDPHPIMIKPKHDGKPTGLKSSIDEVNQKLDVLTKKDKKKEGKEFKIPSKIRKQLKKLALKKKILVILLTRNRGMIPMVTEIKDGFVNIEGTPHQCAVDQVFLWKGKYPAMVIPEWDIRPIGTKDYYDAVANNTVADPIAIAIRMIENKENIMKNKMSPKAWIFIGLAIIAGLYVLFGGGK